MHTTLNPLNWYHLPWLKFRILCEFYLSRKGKPNVHTVWTVSSEWRFRAGPLVSIFDSGGSLLFDHWHILSHKATQGLHCAALKFWASGASPLEDPTPALSIPVNKGGACRWNCAPASESAGCGPQGMGADGEGAVAAEVTVSRQRGPKE